MDEATVAAWVERYVRAWETNDPAAIGDLFAAQARYYPAPDTEPWRDRDGPVADPVRRGGALRRVYGMVDGARPAGRDALRRTDGRGGA
jgi:hypothetical protein